MPGSRARPALPRGPYGVIGLARSGVAAALALARRGERVVGLDDGAHDPPGALLSAGIEVLLGERARTLPADVSVLVKSPGVPQQAPAVEQARGRGIPVLGELELGWRLIPNEFVAVTGTNGKTTTTELIGHIYDQAHAPARVAGNVGTAVSSLAGSTEQADTIICETSSFQLEDTLDFSPEAAVLVNIAPDHLDRHASFADYVAAKARAFERQREQDIAVMPAVLLCAETHTTARKPAPSSASAQRDEQALIALGGAGRARRVTFGSDTRAQLCERDGRLWWLGEPLIATHELRLRGRHNCENAMAAAALCLARGLARGAVAAGLRSFAGVAHRLQHVASSGGVSYVNDSKATNVASTLVALEALADGPRSGPRIHLILGGQGKGQDFAPLGEAAAVSCRACYLIGEDAGLIASSLSAAGVALESCGDLEHAVAAARRRAVAGDVVLLSPACASFDQFQDFEARGERFRELAAG